MTSIVFILYLITPGMTAKAEKNISDISLTKLNIHMERIQPLLNVGQKKLACKEINNSISIIEFNLEGFTEIEPNYNWFEIKSALSQAKEQNCAIDRQTK